ncbi:Calcium/calmodulin-dependent protein kinase kinase 1 [Dermatophagoides pteronyssinus]|uniref:Calcium/calmodulin-dependent protein kinase kinase 1 n=1 Tax=Dermatophagoides pteronyssinus TaxID=6956 RepID=A0ABQ8JRB8_DERPT|nr:Calcium/calmodulin-dependent protein kinase kinase 1 [Dermatophagoides pteronyssinus]
MDLMNEKTKIFCERISQVYDRLRNDFKQMRLSAQSTTNTVDNKDVTFIDQNNNDIGTKISNQNDKKLSNEDSELDQQQQQAPIELNDPSWQEKLDKHLEYLTNQMFRKCLQRNGYKTNDNNWFIAKGGFGSVFRIERDDNRYACKVISNVMQKIQSSQQHKNINNNNNNNNNNNVLNTTKMRSRFYNEVNIMRRASQHENIVTLIDYFENDCSLNENQIVDNNIFADMISAVRYLHGQRIVHRDIKLSNMLLHRPANNNRQNDRFNFIVKLCDFGLSTLVDRNDENLENNNRNYTNNNNNNGSSNRTDDEREIFFKPVGTSIYMAPEILRSYYFYSKKDIDMISPYCAYKGDVWALGVCLFYTLHGFYPLDVVRFNTKQERIEALKQIFEPSNEWQQQQQKYHCNNDSSYTRTYSRNIEKRLRNYNYRLSSNCRDCLSWMLAVQPSKRATIDEIGEHPFIAHAFNNNKNNNNNNRRNKAYII